MEKRNAVILFLASAIANVAAQEPDPVVKAAHVATCLMNLVAEAAPPVALAFVVIGGLTYVSAADDNQQRLMGKTYIIMGATGLILVKVVISLAAMPPFNLVAGCPRLY